MQIRTRIQLVARQRGMTVADLARKLGLYQSNLSAMDAGKRSVSIRMLARLARSLDCSPVELLEVRSEADAPVFRQPLLNQRLAEREAATPDGSDRTAVHRLLWAWQRHYRAVHHDRSA